MRAILWGVDGILRGGGGNEVKETSTGGTFKKEKD